MADDVQLTDLEVIQRYSLAVRGATAPRADLVAALQADLDWLRSGRKAPAPARAVTPAAEPARRVQAPAKSAPAKAPPAKAEAPTESTPATSTPAKAEAPAKSAPTKPAPAKAARKTATASKSPRRRPTA